MSNLSSILENQRTTFRKTFKTASDAIAKRIENLKPSDVNEDIFSSFAPGSSGKQWQKRVVNMLENEISKDIYLKFNEILLERSKYSCQGCATCCNLACSEFSPEELELRAQNGDKFAKQFLSVFIPYQSKEEARKIYPEYIELLENNKEEAVYFYHCPKLTEDKICSDYENRPQICRDFPDNPLTLLPKSFGFCEWKNKHEEMTLLLHAMIEIVEYYKERVKRERNGHLTFPHQKPGSPKCKSYQA